SRFNVRGVDGLRVVDASIFPRIPGYFIVTNIYMASEKAADVIHEDSHFGKANSALYPRELQRKEADAIARRRKAARLNTGQPVHAGAWSSDVTGLALSGGGVRSATFNLGVLQALARRRLQGRIDVLATVSGCGH